MIRKNTMILLILLLCILLFSCKTVQEKEVNSTKPTIRPSIEASLETSTEPKATESQTQIATKEVLAASPAKSPTVKPTVTPTPKSTNRPTMKPLKTPTPNNRGAYGVFLSVMPGETDRIYNYDTVVIDAQYFSKKDINKLHNNGQKVYTYLNVGSIENFRSYYKEYESLTLSAYENWEEERWIDVSSKKWQTFILEKAKELKEKGVDGFFIDNCDVFYVHKKKEIFNGLCSIMEQIRKMKVSVVINGGDTFVKEYLSRYQNLSKIMTGANQETVFSSIDFKYKTFGKASEEDHTYYENYINTCAKNGIKVYLLEYTKDPTLRKKIIEYCNKKGYEYYISISIELE